MNITVLVGRLTKDVECQSYGKGKEKGSYARFAIAVRDGKDEKGEPRTQFINCVAWGQPAETLESYTQKGDMVAVMGRMTENNYTDDEGVKHYALQLTVSQVELLPNNRNDEEDEDEEEKPKKGKYHR